MAPPVTETPCHTIAPNVLDFFHEALARRRHQGIVPRTALVRDEEGQVAGFRLTVSGGIVQDVEYRATTCATLVGLCEHAAQLVAGNSIGEVARINAGSLLALHSEIPTSRRNRALLVERAITAALYKTEHWRRGQ